MCLDKAKKEPPSANERTGAVGDGYGVTVTVVLTVVLR